MNTFQRIAAVTLFALPLVAAAQTANTPGGSASTGTPLDQTKSSTTAPGKTSTAPSATNPSGTLPRDTGTAPADSKMKSRAGKGSMNKSSAEPVGDVPTYPAPAKDGTPTK